MFLHEELELGECKIRGYKQKRGESFTDGEEKEKNHGSGGRSHLESEKNLRQIPFKKLTSSTLTRHIRTDQIAGYDVYVSDDKDRPDSQWRLVRLSNREAALALDNLQSSTEYFVRVNIRNKDGSVIRAPSIYRFKTIEKNGSDEEKPEGNSLAYRNIGPGQVEVSWTYPNDIVDSVGLSSLHISCSSPLMLMIIGGREMIKNQTVVKISQKD
ncbi:hypothetical protein ANCCEY_11809 [Ancylostoma ceylanicum]|uniref:Fibronectin type-III domain-containing protein n=1 Tax=Ancylostoma ceylanicum TaxID=53326 RepID=A0A0D6LB40_9BILA|nr:hypothetical protein ANCCEY_11809 [Ancylostoma ceylanicum]